MIKAAFFQGSEERGPVAIPLFTKADAYFEKVASTFLMPDVVRYISSLRPRADAQYVLLNAMGAGEFWGSNVNGDHFPEAALIHRPDNWTGVPALDAVRAKTWPYGFPTFYNAKPFLHHRNKDFPPHNHPSFGQVELALWNPRMKRVELVARVDKDKCIANGGTGIWDKLIQGQFPDVSMGTKVPYDTCSICLDWDEYNKALATFDPKKHKHPGDAALAFHKHLIASRGRGIRGLSITRKDYCKHASDMMNQILPDGRKVFVYNDFPNFFDISFVFIGADKTAKVMLKIATEGALSTIFQMPAAAPAEELGYGESADQGLKPEGDREDDTPKFASANLEEFLLGKQAKAKKSEMVKDVVPSQFAAKAIPAMAKKEPSIPTEILDALSVRPLEEGLSTATGMGIVLRPHEFQRLALNRMGQRSLANDLEAEGLVFPKSEEENQLPLNSTSFNPILAKLLLPLMAARSSFSPYISLRLTMRPGTMSIEQEEICCPEKKNSDSSLSIPVLHKIGAAYNGYRKSLMGFIAESQTVLSQSGLTEDAFAKLAQVPMNELFTSLTATYLKTAFVDEIGKVKLARAGVERGSPSRNTWNSAPLDGDSHP